MMFYNPVGAYVRDPARRVYSLRREDSPMKCREAKSACARLCIPDLRYFWGRDRTCSLSERGEPCTGAELVESMEERGPPDQREKRPAKSQFGFACARANLSLCTAFVGVSPPRIPRSRPLSALPPRRSTHPRARGAPGELGSSNWTTHSALLVGRPRDRNGEPPCSTRAHVANLADG